MSTFVELYGDLLDRELGSADRAQLFTTARRQAAINEAQREWVRLTESFTREVVFTLADAVGEYDLEARAEAFWAVAKPGVELTITDAAGDTRSVAGDDLPRRDIVWLNREETGWRDASPGTPTAWYLRDDGGRTLLGLSPAPDIGAGELWTVRVPYVAQPADLSADTDEPFTVHGNASARLRPYHKALGHYAAAQLELLRRDSAAHDLQLQRFSGYVTQYLQAQRPRGGTHVVFARDYRREARGTTLGSEDPWR